MSDASAQHPLRDLTTVRHLSPFVDGLLTRYPQWQAAADAAPDLPPPDPDQDSTTFDRALRLWRNQAMVRIAVRDLMGEDTLADTLTHLSRLAEAALDTTLSHHRQQLATTFGRPRDAAGEELGLVVVALGKLGGGELNFSSDIDIVLVSSGSGKTDGPRSLPSDRYFNRLIQRVIASLGQVTEDGFVFRVDTRLRPFGSVGALVQTIDAMERYYQSEGRDWERYAWIKARPVAGDIALGQELIERLQPFVYRRYVDYGALEALRHTHERIRREAVRRDRLQDLKRGPGGIRESEFIVQSYQLLRGGKEADLRTPSWRRAMEAIRQLQLMPATDCQRLSRDYAFLRTTENRLQAMRDQQTHELPESTEDRARLATAMGHGDWNAFHTELQQRRQAVATQFDELFRQGEDTTRQQGGQFWQRLWAGREPLPEDAEWRALGAERQRLIRGWVPKLQRLELSQRADQRLERLMPGLVRRMVAADIAARGINDLLRLVHGVSRRSAYLALLLENPKALDRLIRLVAGSEWLAEQVIRFPALLDELIDPLLTDQLPDRQTLLALIERRVQREPDTELALEQLGYLRLSGAFRIAIAFLEGSMTAPRAARELTDLSESCLRAALALSQRDRPCPQLAVVAYGALGAADMHWGSDLDLVFLLGEDGEAHAARRCVQRLIHLLTTYTNTGRLFAVDSRLRPDGQAGLLVSRVAAYQRYQMEQAWTWELQALTRARWVAGYAHTQDPFEQIRRQALCRPRAEGALRQSVADMRYKLRRQRPDDSPLTRDKQRPGGLLDLQFLIQHGVLAQAANHPEVIASPAWTRQLRALTEVGHFSREEQQSLAAAWETAMGRMGTLALAGGENTMVADDAPLDQYPPLAALWESLFGSPQRED